MTALPVVPAVPLRWRSVLVLAAASAVGVVAFGWPLLAGSSTLARLGGHVSDAPWLFVGLLVLLLAVVLAEVADGGLDARAVAVLGVLAGTDAALRPLNGGAVGFTFFFLLIVLGGRVFGAGFGFVLGALSFVASALLTAGVGPWLPFQMLGAAWIGAGAAWLPRRLRGWWELAVLAAYGAVTGLLYGLLLNLSSWPFATYLPAQVAMVPGGGLGVNLAHWVRYDLTTSLGFDVPRAVGNVVLTAVFGRPVLAALRRIARRAAFAPAGQAQ